MPKNRLPEWATNYQTLVEGRAQQDIIRRVQILERVLGRAGVLGTTTATDLDTRVTALETAVSDLDARVTALGG